MRSDLRAALPVRLLLYSSLRSTRGEETPSVGGSLPHDRLKRTDSRPEPRQPVRTSPESASSAHAYCSAHPSTVGSPRVPGSSPSSPFPLRVLLTAIWSSRRPSIHGPAILLVFSLNVSLTLISSHHHLGLHKPPNQARHATDFTIIRVNIFTYRRVTNAATVRETANI